MDLSGLTYRVARSLGIVEESTATGGSTTTIADTVGRKEADNYWVGTGNKTSTVWLLKDAAGAGAAPEGQYGKVTAYTLTTPASTLTFTPAMTVAVASGDTYAIAKKRYPLHILIQMVNQALSDLGTVPYTDTTTLNTGSTQTEYDLPAAANLDLRGVYIQGNLNDANDNNWVPVPYKLIYSDIGTGHKLVIPQMPDGRDLMVVYMRVHPTLAAYADKMSEMIHPDRVVYNAALKCLRWWQARTSSIDGALMKQMQDIELEAAKAEVKHPIRLPKRQAKFLYIGNEGIIYPGEQVPR